MDSSGLGIIFTTCVKGHDLSLPDAYSYKDSGFRECRECVAQKAPKRNREALSNTFVKPV